MGSIDDGEGDKPDNLRIEAFCRQSLKTHIEGELRSGRLKVAGFTMPEANEQTAVSPPIYNEAHYVVTCPNASGHLPVRQDCFFQQSHSFCFLMSIEHMFVMPGLARQSDSHLSYFGR